MKFNFKQLDVRTRTLMIKEIEHAAGSENIYFSARFTYIKHINFPDGYLKYPAR